MNIGFGEVQTKYHQQKVKTATVTLPGRARIELALSDTARCARMPDAARRTIINLAGGEDEFADEKDINTAATQLHQHCRRLMNLKD